MEVTARSPVHYYDTSRHLILCGLRGFDHRSTKHSRDVTCEACVGLLRARPTGTAAVAPGAPVGGTIA